MSLKTDASLESSTFSAPSPNTTEKATPNMTNVFQNIVSCKQNSKLNKGGKYMYSYKQRK